MSKSIQDAFGVPPVATATGHPVANASTAPLSAESGQKLPELHADLARRDLIEWARVMRQRDERILRAFAAGVPLREIERLTGVARTTVRRLIYRDLAAGRRQGHDSTGTGTGSGGSTG